MQPRVDIDIFKKAKQNVANIRRSFYQENLLDIDEVLKEYASSLIHGIPKYTGQSEGFAKGLAAAKGITINASSSASSSVSRNQRGQVIFDKNTNIAKGNTYSRGYTLGEQSIRFFNNRTANTFRIGFEIIDTLRSAHSNFAYRERWYQQVLTRAASRAYFTLKESVGTRIKSILAKGTYRHG